MGRRTLMMNVLELDKATLLKGGGISDEKKLRSSEEGKKYAAVDAINRAGIHTH